MAEAVVQLCPSFFKAELVLDICSLDAKALHLSPSSLNNMQLGSVT